MKKIILIAGKAGSGKDTFANILAQKLRDKQQRVGRDMFARYLKSMLVTYFGWDGKTKDEEIRSKLQYFGTDRAKLELNFKNYHSRRIAEDIQVLEECFDYFILSDLRFKEEAFYLKSSFPESVTTIEVVRDNFKSKLTKEQQAHKSENDLNDFMFDIIVENNEGLKELERMAEEIIEGLSI